MEVILVQVRYLCKPLSGRNTQKQRATASKEIGLNKPILQPIATPRNRCRRIVAPKVAGSSPVGHPSIYRIGKANPRKRGADWCSCGVFRTYTNYAPGLSTTMTHADRESLYEGGAGTAVVVAGSEGRGFELRRPPYYIAHK